MLPTGTANNRAGIDGRIDGVANHGPRVPGDAEIKAENQEVDAKVKSICKGCCSSSASFFALAEHGFGAIATSHPPNFQVFSLKDDAGGLWVAEEAGEILGFAWSWVCGDLWFLAQLFVSPGHQGRGIGNKLRRAF